MKVKSRLGAEQVKAFSKNHKKHKITIKTYGKPAKGRSAIFEAKLSEFELIQVCDFITKNFTKKGA